MTLEVRELDEWQLEQLWQNISLYDANGRETMLVPVRTRRAQLQVLRDQAVRRELKYSEFGEAQRNDNNTAYIRPCNHCGVDVLDHLTQSHLACFHPELFIPDWHPAPNFTADTWLLLHEKLEKEYPDTKLDYETRETIAHNVQVIDHVRNIVMKMGTSTMRSRFVAAGMCAWGCKDIHESSWRIHVVVHHLTDISIEEEEVA